MAAVIRIEIAASGGIDDVKKDVADFGKTAEASGSGFSALKEIGIGALRAIGTAAVDLAIKGFQALAGAVQDGIADAQKNAQIQAQTAAVLESTGNAAGKTTEQIAEYASSLSDAAGTSLFGDDQIQQSTNLLLTFSEIKGATLDAATAISVDMAQAMGGAPKDAAIQLGKALNDPIKGITALTRVGVVFSDEQKAQIQAMQEAGDTAGAQAVILAELNKEFGGSAQAAADATGGWSEFNGRMGEAKEAMGAAVLPLLTTLAGVLNDSVLPVVESAAAAFGDLIQYFVAVSEDGDTMNDFLGNLPTFLQPIVRTIGDVAVALQGFMASFADTSPLDTFTSASATLGAFWATQLQPAFDAVWVALQTQVWPILNDLATALFPLVGAAIQILAGYWTDVLVPALQMLWGILTTVILPVIAALAGWLRDVLPGAIATVTGFLTGTLFPALHTVYEFISANVIPILALAAKWLIENVPVAIQKAADYWNTVLLPALNAAWAFIQDQVIPIIVRLVNDSFVALNSAVQTVSDYWTGTLEPALRAVWAFIQTYVIPIFNTLTTVSIAFLKAEVAALGALWRTVLLPALTAVWEFIDQKVVPIFKAMYENYIVQLKKSVNDMVTVWNERFLPAMQAVWQFIYDKLGPIFANFNTNVLQPMQGWFSDIGSAVDTLLGYLHDLAAMWDSMKPPDWVVGHSPPPMANWFNDIAGGAAALNVQLAGVNAGLAQPLGGGSTSISNMSSARSFTYAPSYSGVGASEGPMDLALATSLAGV